MSGQPPSPYRWVILLSMLPMLAMTNVCWLSFAPVTSTAEAFYSVSPLRIAFLSMCYMVVYIALAAPASWLVDTRGFRFSIMLGVALTALFAGLRGLYASNFVVVTLAQIGTAAGQPFLINSTTKMAAKWFPVHERATAGGIATMAGYAGMVVALVVTPVLAGRYGLVASLRIDAYASLACALVLVAFSRAHPKAAASEGDEPTYILTLASLREVMCNPDFKWLTLCMFVMMGVFNGVATWLEDMLRPRGISAEQSGIIGGVMVATGLVGALVLPMLSDRMRVRRRMIIIAVFAALPGMLGLVAFSHYGLLVASGAVLGFFLLGAGPIGFQYGAEVAHPVPEGTSYGILMSVGQVSGAFLVYAMDKCRMQPSGSMTPALWVLFVLMAASSVLTLKLRESPLILAQRRQGAKAPCATRAA